MDATADRKTARLESAKALAQTIPSSNASDGIRATYLALVAESESDNGDGWRDVYLDNARRDETVNQFRGRLSRLAQLDLYRVVDGYAWGSVRIA